MCVFRYKFGLSLLPPIFNRILLGVLEPIVVSNVYDLIGLLEFFTTFLFWRILLWCFCSLASFKGILLCVFGYCSFFIHFGLLTPLLYQCFVSYKLSSFCIEIFLKYFFIIFITLRIIYIWNINQYWYNTSV